MSTPAIPLPQLTVEYRGLTYTLNKHPSVQLALRRGEMSLEQAKFKPWYLRMKVQGKDRTFKLAAKDADARRGAVDTLKGHLEKPTEFNAWLADRDARNGLTLQSLADDWFKHGLPDDDGRPRSADASAPLKAFAEAALRYWGPKIAKQVNRAQMLDFAEWRRNKCLESKRGTGDRSADLELSALSSLCQWAVASQKLETNPFAERPRFRRSEDVRHCHEFMPESDEAWHRVLTWFWTTEYDQKKLSNRYKAPDLTLRLRIAGAWLAFTGLTGLRPEEPQYLYRFPALAQPPASPDKLPAGTIFPTRDGQRKMKIVRTKHGQNPYVVLHPAAADFLDHWSKWLDAHLEAPAAGTVQAWFPNPANTAQPICSDDFSLLNKRLADACAAGQLPELKPKGFGRAFYVRVRRSQGADDATIAGELGQTTNGKLIRETYGNPDDMMGGALFDWLPEDEKQKPIDAAWQPLTAVAATPSNVIHL